MKSFIPAAQSQKLTSHLSPLEEQFLIIDMVKGKFPFCTRCWIPASVAFESSVDWLSAWREDVHEEVSLEEWLIVSKIDTQTVNTRLKLLKFYWLMCTACI